ncbi:MAG: UvrD-helicase domain-containing protein [Bryobacterales bacterium]|nr:UvrD-helicase domain-containing protein [Bryobacterales bacterium]
MKPLRIVRSGAGSGKTYSIQHSLGELVESGEVAPERIAAVTYTEAAAGELRERIGRRLLEMGRVDDALRLSEAYISTIHAFGLRILTEFAFEAGTSPMPRLLTEHEQGALLRRALATTDKANSLVDELESFGYVYDAATKTSGFDGFRNDVLNAVELLRAIRAQESDRVNDLIRRAKRQIRDRYGPTCNAGRARSRLTSAVRALLARFPNSLAESFGTNKTARNHLHRDFNLLTRAVRTGALRTEWKLWQGLRDLRLSKRGCQLPEEYDGLATRVKDAADSLVAHPGPLRHACDHLESLLLAAHDVHGHYRSAKRQAGLVDYSDMTAAAGRLIRDRPDALAGLAARIDCLVVDEFQDTNPLQFALLWSLREHGIPTFVVGDLKQAIMGFQGADPRLFDHLARQHSAATESLRKNWRSQPSLMRVINAIGQQLFGEDYTPLEPRAQASPVGPLDLVVTPTKPKKNAVPLQAQAMGVHLRDILHGQALQVTDRETGKSRPLRAADIAVLCPTNFLLAAYADEFRKLGLAVNCPAEGWLQSRPVQIAKHALAYLANSADRHSALYLAVTELGSLRLEEGLRQLMETGSVRDPLLDRLDELADGVADRTVYALVADVVDALGLFDEVSTWSDAEQARANLVQLLATAGEFMNSDRAALAHGGYHGSGILPFLAWLDDRMSRDDFQPDKHVIDEDEIVLRTWHGSKGLEWPVVAVCGLYRKVAGRLPFMGTDYESFDDLAGILERAYVRRFPKFTAKEQNESALLELQMEAETEARRLLYVALSRARHKLVIEWPKYLAKSRGKTVTYWSVLGANAIRVGPYRQFRIGDRSFPYEPAATAEQYATARDDWQDRLPETGRRAIRRAPVPDALTPDSLSPSLIEVGRDRKAQFRAERYGPGLTPQVGLGGTALGEFLHLCFELVGPRPDLAARIPELTGVDVKPRAMAEIVGAVERFEGWLNGSLQPREVLREWPVLTLDPTGTVISGTVDVLVRCDGGWWIVDHKSDKVADPEGEMGRYADQLEAYSKALTAAGEHVLGAGINWIRRGQVFWMEATPESGRPPGLARLGVSSTTFPEDSAFSGSGRAAN